MANNFYTATEALLRAYEEIDKNYNLIEVAGASVRLPNRMDFYAQSLGLEKPTLTQRLLGYYNSTDEVFSTKKSKQQDVASSSLKDEVVVDYLIVGAESQVILSDANEIKLTDEELEDTHNELFTSVNLAEGELPKINNPFTSDENSHNQKPLEPNKDDV